MKFKLITLVFLLSSMTISCQDKTADHYFSELTYEASTRGYMLRISVEKDLISVESSTEDEPRSFQVSKKISEELNSMVSAIDLNKIDNLEPPSKASESDSAPMAYLSVTQGGKTYQSSYFDHGNPPGEIKLLISALIKLANVD